MLDQSQYSELLTDKIKRVAVNINYCAVEYTYQKDMFKDLRRTVHLTQDDNHLFVNEALELSQVARHVHLQLCSDLWNTQGQKSTRVSFYTLKMEQ